MPRLEVHVEVQQDIEPSAELVQRLRETLSNRLRVSSVVAVEKFGALPRTEVGKVKRVFERTSDADPLPLPR
jgi:acyl-coenzyme A synthetase/AMP-(fatty) acid ligase